MSNPAKTYRYHPSGSNHGSTVLSALMNPVTPSPQQAGATRKRVLGLRQRHQLRKLLRFDDRTLADMGHSRTEIMHALHRSRQAPIAYESSNIHLQNMHPELPRVWH